MFSPTIGILLFVLACSQAVDFNAEFGKFAKIYGRKYDKAERGKRLGVFTANLKRILALQKAGRKDVGINGFADVDPAEFKKSFVIPVDFVKSHPHKNRTGHDTCPEHLRSKRAVAPIPTSFDYRARGWVTAIKNQGRCGSCYVFAGVAGMESIYRRFRALTMDFSEQLLVDCDSPPNYGCGGGWTDYVLDYVFYNGVTTEAVYPYKAVKGTCRNVVKPFKGVDYYYLAGEAQIPAHIFRAGPVAFSFRVPASFQHYAGGVFNPADCVNNIVGYHEMVIVGYTPTYWIVKNSWGTGFGAAGYVYFARGKNLCGMASELIAIYKV